MSVPTRGYEIDHRRYDCPVRHVARLRVPVVETERWQRAGSVVTSESARGSAFRLFTGSEGQRAGSVVTSESARSRRFAS